MASRPWICSFFSTIPAWTIENLQEAHSRALFPTTSFVFKGLENQKMGIVEQPVSELPCSPLTA